MSLGRVGANVGAIAGLSLDQHYSTDQYREDLSEQHLDDPTAKLVKVFHVLRGAAIISSQGQIAERRTLILKMVMQLGYEPGFWQKLQLVPDLRPGCGVRGKGG